MANRIWIDVEDLFEYWSAGVRLSGIQRLEFELCRALVALPESKGRVFFVRRGVGREGLTTVPWEAVETIFSAMSSESGEGEASAERSSKKPPSKSRPVRTMARSLLRKALYALPPGLRKVVIVPIEAFAALARAVRIARTVKRHDRFENSTARISSASAECFAATARQGDILAALGSPWSRPDGFIERVVREKRLRFALLIYDIIPLRRPEWVDIGNANAFRAWFDGALSLADTIFTISAATAKDVTWYARNKALALRTVPTPIPIGTGFKRTAEKRRSANAAVPNRLLPADSYALVVSTIEPRKNHALLFAVWRRLLEDLPAAKVPTLVFAGRTGWLVSDLMQQLRNCNFLDDKIVHIESPTDEELEALYEGCLFTLFPSFYEGWGLPVTESLAFGRPCIISKATSLPEAGGSLARYIDPDNATDTYRVIRETIEDPVGLRAWRDRVRREFRPVEWSESARAVLRVLDSAQDALAPAETKLRRSA